MASTAATSALPSSLDTLISTFDLEDMRTTANISDILTLINNGLFYQSVGNVAAALASFSSAATYLYAMKKINGSTFTAGDKALPKILGYVEQLQQKIQGIYSPSGSSKGGSGGKGDGEDEEKDWNTACRVIDEKMTEDSKLCLTFGDVIGLNEPKQLMVSSIIYPIVYPNLFTKQASGVLLYGPPGTGKTFLMAATVRQLKILYPNVAQINFFPLTGADLKGKYVGETEKRIVGAYTCAAIRACQAQDPGIKEYPKKLEDFKKKTKELLAERSITKPEDVVKNYPQYISIVFIDEFDSIGRDRMKDETGISSSSVNTLLQVMDGVDSFKNVITVAATNYPWDLDAALLRRFKEHIYLKVPEFEDIKALIRKEIEDRFVVLDTNKRMYCVNKVGKTLYTPSNEMANYVKTENDRKSAALKARGKEPTSGSCDTPDKDMFPLWLVDESYKKMSGDEMVGVVATLSSKRYSNSDISTIINKAFNIVSQSVINRAVFIKLTFNNETYFISKITPITTQNLLAARKIKAAGVKQEQIAEINTLIDSIYGSATSPSYQLKTVEDEAAKDCEYETETPDNLCKMKLPENIFIDDKNIQKIFNESNDDGKTLPEKQITSLNFGTQKFVNIRYLKDAPSFLISYDHRIADIFYDKSQIENLNRDMKSKKSYELKHRELDIIFTRLMNVTNDQKDLDSNNGLSNGYANNLRMFMYEALDPGNSYANQSARNFINTLNELAQLDTNFLTKALLTEINNIWKPSDINWWQTWKENFWEYLPSDGVNRLRTILAKEVTTRTTLESYIKTKSYSVVDRINISENLLKAKLQEITTSGASTLDLVELKKYINNLYTFKYYTEDEYNTLDNNYNVYVEKHIANVGVMKVGTSRIPFWKIFTDNIKKFTQKSASDINTIAERVDFVKEFNFRKLFFFKATIKPFDPAWRLLRAGGANFTLVGGTIDLGKGIIDKISDFTFSSKTDLSTAFNNQKVIQSINQYASVTKTTVLDYLLLRTKCIGVTNGGDDSNLICVGKEPTTEAGPSGAAAAGTGSAAAAQQTAAAAQQTAAAAQQTATAGTYRPSSIVLTAPFNTFKRQTGTGASINGLLMAFFQSVSPTFRILNGTQKGNFISFFRENLLNNFKIKDLLTSQGATADDQKVSEIQTRITGGGRLTKDELILLLSAFQLNAILINVSTTPQTTEYIYGSQRMNPTIVLTVWNGDHFESVSANPTSDYVLTYDYAAGEKLSNLTTKVTDPHSDKRITEIYNDTSAVRPTRGFAQGRGATQLTITKPNTRDLLNKMIANIFNKTGPDAAINYPFAPTAGGSRSTTRKNRRSTTQKTRKNTYSSYSDSEPEEEQEQISELTLSGGATGDTTKYEIHWFDIEGIPGSNKKSAIQNFFKTASNTYFSKNALGYAASGVSVGGITTYLVGGTLFINLGAGAAIGIVLTGSVGLFYDWYNPRKENQDYFIINLIVADMFNKNEIYTKIKDTNFQYSLPEIFKDDYTTKLKARSKRWFDQPDYQGSLVEHNRGSASKANQWQFNAKLVEIKGEMDYTRVLSYYMDTAYLAEAMSEYPSTWNDHLGNMLQEYYENREQFLLKYQRGEYDEKKKPKGT